MEVQETIRTQFTKEELVQNYYEMVKTITETVKDKDWSISIDGVEIELIYLKPDFNNLSNNARKNLAKRMYYVDKKKSRKTINTFFFIAKKLGVIDEKVYITLGKKEREIQRKRKIWTIMRDKAQQALSEYKKEKVGFY
tara:strand:+ start:588 stop:1004 length:417 start_codon:yes stop_codon:yes gene_type:complete